MVGRPHDGWVASDIDEILEALRAEREFWRRPVPPPFRENAPAARDDKQEGGGDADR